MNKLITFNYKLNHPVHKITDNSDSFDILCKLDRNSIKKFTCKHIIFAVPISILKQTFSQFLPTYKNNILKKMGLCSLECIALVFKNI